MKPTQYSEKVKEHFKNPKNVGEIENPDGVGVVGNPLCGDMMQITIKVSKDGRLEDIKFKTYGCGSAIATSSMITEMAKGMTLEEALKITRKDVAEELEGLPPIKMHCSNLAADALHAAIKDYLQRKERGEIGQKAKGEIAFDYDVIVVGGGPAGLTAATQIASRGLSVAVFEGKSWGGVLSTLYPNKKIMNFPGLPENTLGRDFVTSLLKQARDSGVELKNEFVNEVSPEKVVKTAMGEYRARAVILATGTLPLTCGIPGENEFIGDDKGVYYYVTYPEKFMGKRVLVYGNGEQALESALTLENIADKLTFAYKEKDLVGSEKAIKTVKRSDRIKLLANTELVKIEGTDTVEKVVLHDLGEDEDFELVVDKVVLAVGMKPNTEIYSKLGIELDERGFVKVDKDQRTNIEGIYAAGDLTTDLQLLVVAISQGATAAHRVSEYVQKQKGF
ncbi:MAG: Fe-S cluster assembly scaffold protein NifU [Candidatus Jordarchaeaceae archaeon]